MRRITLPVERRKIGVTMSKQKIAIACQGGGSQTAFTAGVLSAFFQKDLHHQKQIVSLSGTSGGAVCAALAWYGLLKAASGDRVPIQKRMTDFWEELMPKLPPELLVDQWGAKVLRMIADGSLPHLELSPVSKLNQIFNSMLTSMLPRRFFTDLKFALESHIAFNELPNLIKSDSPVLILGAANVLTGELKKFNSRKGEIQVEAILASAAIPTLFEAVQIGNDYYWDGLFSDNPPVKELVRAAFVGPENIPDELWVIQINPIAVDALPKTNSQIADRRNQMEGNVSLMQGLEFIEFFNLLIKEQALDPAKAEQFVAQFGAGFHMRKEPIAIRFIRMSPDLHATLDYVSKISRDPPTLHRLIEDGKKQGRAFLESLEPIGAGAA
jgi:NTE family protein